MCIYISSMKLCKTVKHTYELDTSIRKEKRKHLYTASDSKFLGESTDDDQSVLA